FFPSVYRPKHQSQSENSGGLLLAECSRHFSNPLQNAVLIDILSSIRSTSPSYTTHWQSLSPVQHSNLLASHITVQNSAFRFTRYSLTILIRMHLTHRYATIHASESLTTLLLRIKGSSE